MSTESLRARLDAATPGPWWLSEVEGHTSDVMGDGVGYAKGREETWVATVNEYPAGADAAFIVHAPTDLAAALKVIEAAKYFEEVCDNWDSNQCPFHCWTGGERPEGVGKTWADYPHDDDCPYTLIHAARAEFESLP